MKVFKLEGSSDFYLCVKGITNWAIRSNLKSDKMYIHSGNAGKACPAHPQNKVNKKYNRNDWRFNKAKEDDNEEDWDYLSTHHLNNEEDWEEGGVVVQCTLHDQSTVKKYHLRWR